MNTALKYTKIDYILTKKQNYIILLFAVISSIMFVKGKEELFAVAYMSFAAIVLSTSPFNIENNSDSGFLDMLPSKTCGRVLGRYLYSLSLCLIAFLVQVIQVFIAANFFTIKNENILYINVMILAISIILCSVEYLMFYIIGRTNKKQLMSLMSLVPAFAFMFGGSAVIDKLKENTDEFSSIVSYLNNNIEILSGIFILISIIVFICCVSISSIIVEKRGKL